MAFAAAAAAAAVFPDGLPAFSPEEPGVDMMRDSGLANGGCAEVGSNERNFGPGALSRSST